jgi:hypothetical protein
MSGREGKNAGLRGWGYFRKRAKITSERGPDAFFREEAVEAKASDEDGE